MEVDSYLRRKFEGAIKDVEVVFKEDLDLVSDGRSIWKGGGAYQKSLVTDVKGGELFCWSS